MKQTSRKKMLVSSVAMMMVATVSLGSATFAWFSQNTTATANGVNVKTVKGSNLVLCETNSLVASDWKSTLDLNIDDKRLEPASTKDCTNWFKTKATIYNAAATETGGRGTVTPITTGESGGYYIAKEFYVKSVAEGITANFQVNVSATSTEANNQLDYVRVAMRKESGDLTKIYGNKAADNSCLTAVTPTQGTQDITTSAISDTLTLTADTAQKVTLYIWFEGEDPECKDVNAGVDVTVSVDFSKSTT